MTHLIFCRLFCLIRSLLFLTFLSRKRSGVRIPSGLHDRVDIAPTVALDTDALDALAQIDALKLEGLPVHDEGAGVLALVERSAIVRWVEVATGAAR
jgi:hypothetical protein